MGEQNERCLKCRWCYDGDLTCVNPASDYHGEDVSLINTDDCDYFHHNICEENMFRVDEDTKEMEFING